MKKIIFRISAIFLSILVTFLLLELGVRLLYKFRFKPQDSAHIPAPWIYRLSNNKHLLYELLPKSKARVEGIEYEINAFGFRDKKYRERKVHEKRIIFVGDSLTFGWNLTLKDTYHKQLETLMTARGHSVDVFGMGVVGYNTVQEYFLINNNIARFSPDMVILQVCPNDFERTLSIRISPDEKNFALTPYYDFSIPYVFKKGSSSQFLMRHSHFYRFLNLKLSWLKKKRDKDYNPMDVFLLGEEKSVLHLKRIKKYLDRNGIPLSVIIFPFRQIEGNYIYSSLHERVHELLEEMDIPYFDLFEDFNRKFKDVDIWVDRLHPNAEGNEAAAQKLYEFLTPLLFGPVN